MMWDNPNLRTAGAQGAQAQNAVASNTAIENSTSGNPTLQKHVVAQAQNGEAPPA
jgi:hypothetical protein